MAILIGFFLSFVFVFLLKLKLRWKTKESPTNWPVIGMLPSILINAHRFHDFMTEILISHKGTFFLKGPRFCNMDMMFTSNPLDVHHVFSKSFMNYPKGPEFNKIFEDLGDGIFNADFKLWEIHRRTTLGFFTRGGFRDLIERTVWGKVEEGLFPVLDSFVKKADVLDLQRVFQRLAFDNICKLVLDFDPRSLSVGLPEIPCEKAFTDLTDALFYRHLLPEPIWRLQKFLGIGKEGLLAAAWKVFDEFIYPKTGDWKNKDDYSLLTSFTAAYEENGVGSEENLSKFLRDTSLSLMFAGRDTTATCLTWLFWLIHKNPTTETKILQELEDVLGVKPGGKWKLFTAEESRRLVYLHGALSESLRLFPPVPLEHKSPVEDDILPSGIHMEKNTRLVFSFYSMGRMESIWGKNWPEFMPERWITGSGGVKYEPSYRFPAFNAGPRTCLGKEMAFIQMKMVAAAILFRYKIEVYGDSTVSTRDSVILQAKNGLKVKLTTRKV